MRERKTVWGMAMIGLATLVVAFGASRRANNRAPSSLINVTAGDSLQAAVDSAVYGDTILIQAGASFGPLLLRSKSGSGTITIKTAGSIPTGVRVGPANESQMPKIVSQTSAPALEAEADSHDYVLNGLIVTSVGGSVFTDELILLGARSSGGAIPIGHTPHHITFDQCWIREATNDTITPDASTTTSDRGFDISINFITIINSRIGGFRAWKGLTATSGAESSNAILLAGSVENAVIDNNYLESWFVPVFMAPIASSPNTAALTNPTYDPVAHTWAANFSSVRNLQVGDLVALKTTEGRTPSTNSAHPNEGVVFQVGRVTGIVGSRVTGISWGSPDGDIAGGNPVLQVPDSPGLAQWRGFTNQHITIRHNQFVVAFNAAERVWVNSGGCATTIPYPPSCLNSGDPKTGNAPKSFIEIKSATDVLVDANTFDGWYTSLILLTPRNQGNALTSGGVPWAGDYDIRVTNNYMKRMANWNRAFSLVIGGPQLQDNEYSNVRSGPVLIQNNLFDSGAAALLSAMNSADGVTVKNNTYPGSTSGDRMVNAFGSPSSNFIFRNNILSHGEYGMSCQSPTSCWPASAQDHNVIIDNRSSGAKNADGPLTRRYPADMISADQAAIGWISPATSNYHLGSSSPYKGRGSDGRDPGVDMDALLAALSGGPPPSPSPSTTPPCVWIRTRDTATQQWWDCR